jgi:hypothetical protein
MSDEIARLGASERRSEERGATVFRPVLIETDGFVGFCLVRNLSPSGMRAKVYTSFCPNEQMALRFSSDLAVAGRLVWSDADHIGVKFDRPIDVTHVLSALGRREVDGRVNRALRLPLNAPGELVIDDRSVAVELQDISHKGVKVASAILFRPGEELLVRLEDMTPRKAIVRWSQAGSMGLNFVRPISFDDLARWVVQQQMPGSLGEMPAIETSSAAAVGAF